MPAGAVPKAGTQGHVQGPEEKSPLGPPGLITSYWPKGAWVESMEVMVLVVQLIKDSMVQHSTQLGLLERCW